jgi:hypothetical protein
VGENAIRKYDNQEVKIGTCENMYYIRYTDRDLVSPAENSLDCSKELNLFWRLPFPDEDEVRIGAYRPYDRTAPLMKNGACYHDIEDISLTCDHYGTVVLESLKNHKLSTKDDNLFKVMPVIKCTACGQLWRAGWEDIREYVAGELRARLDSFFKYKTTDRKTYWVDFKGVRVEADSKEEAVAHCLRTYGNLICVDSLEEITD